MLIQDEVEKAVRLQACGYQLLKWLEKALTDGFITPETAGTYATSEDAAYLWLDKHYLNLPNSARPERSDLLAFSNFFSTYLDSTFDLDANPGDRLYSPDAHCFCSICSWMVQEGHHKRQKGCLEDEKNFPASTRTSSWNFQSPTRCWTTCCEIRTFVNQSVSALTLRIFCSDWKA